MADNPFFQLRISPAMRAAMYAHVAKHGGSVSTLAREAIAKALGDRSLAEVAAQGRPRKDAEPEPAAKPVRGRPKKEKS